MSKYNLFRSILALVLTVAMFISMVPGVFASTGTDREQIVVNASDLVAAETGEAQAERYEESVAKRLAEEYGLEDEEVEDTEFGYLSEEERKELGITTPPTVNDVVTPDYVFLNFNVGSSSRRMNWQMKTSSTKDQYFSQNKQGFLCAYYNGEDAFLYSPLETDPLYKTARLKGYQMKSGDIARIYIGSLKENALITSSGTATFNSNFFIHSSESVGKWTAFTDSTTKLTRKTGAHELTWNIMSSNVGDTLYGVRWDAIEETLSAETQIYIDYIYVGPKETAPVNVQYVDENDSMLTHGGNWVGWGKKAMAWSTGKENTDNGDGTQTIWGWSVYNKVNGTWTATGKFVTDPSTYVCKEDTRFKLTEVKIRKADLDSKQEYDNGESTKDDKYVLTIDGFDTAEMDLGGYGTPLDVCIVMDRSGSQGEFVEKMDFGANKKSVDGTTTLTKYLETLDKSMDPGYYRATAFRQRKADGITSKGISQYIYSMPLRYYRGEWQMQCLIKCTCNKKDTQTIAEASHQSYGIYRWNATGALQCSHVQWITVESGYDKFVEYLENTGFDADNMGKEITFGQVKELLAFSVGISRLGRTQEAIENFLERLYVSSTNLKPGQTHTVSVIGYGRTVFMSGYPYADANGGYKTKNAYADGSITSKSIDHTTYEKVLKVVNTPYIDGATRTDAAFEVLSGDCSDIEDEAGYSATTQTKTDYLPEKNTADPDARKRVVILLTDGVPSSNDVWDGTVATQAVTASGKLKKDGVTVYTIGVMDGLDSTVSTIYNNSKNANRANDFLNTMSSRYKEATAWNVGGKLTKGDYYFSDNAAGSNIAIQMEAIWGGNAPTLTTSKSGPASLWLLEDYGREWMPDPEATVKIYGESYIGNGEYSGEKILIGEHKVKDHTESEDIPGNGYILHYYYYEEDQSFAYALQWTDAKTAFLRETPMNAGSQAQAISGTLDTSLGYKVYMEMPIEVDRDNTLGGNNIPLTTDISGCYQAKDASDKEMGARLFEYVQPNANVSCVITANAYDYFISLEDYVAIASGKQTAKVNDVLMAMAGIPKDLKMANDHGLSNMDYVSFDLQLKNGSGNLLFRRATKLHGTDFSIKNDNGQNYAESFKKDITLTLLSDMTFASHNVDSYNRDPYEDIHVELDPTYYVPLYAVADYGDNITVPLGMEGDNINNVTVLSKGTLNKSGKSITFVADNAIINGTDGVSYSYKTKYAPKGAESDVVSRKVTVIPANVVAYDDSVLTDVPAKTEMTGEDTTLNYLAWETVGNKIAIEQSYNNSAIHGYDSKYDTTEDFHGSTKMVTVGERKTVDEETGKVISKETDTAHTTFTFTGTGFEILSRTTDNSGVIIAEVFSGDKMPESETAAEGSLVASILCNTYMEGGNNKQVPVIRWDAEAYGTYTVRLIAYYNPIFAYRADSKDALTAAQVKEILGYSDNVDFTYIPAEGGRATRKIVRSYDVYIDGIRVFNPLESSAVVDYVYGLAGETVSDFTNVQNIVIRDVSNWDGQQKVDGILYLSDRTDDPITDNDETQAGPNDTTSSKLEGYPLVMDGDITIETDEATGRTYYFGTDGEPIKDPKTNAVIFSMWYTKPGEEKANYYYMAENPNATPETPYLFFNRTVVRELLGEAGIFYSSRYKSLGAKTEIQLIAGSGIAFNVNATKVHLSLKSENGKACTVEVYNGSSWNVVVSDLTSATEAFYDLSKYVKNGSLIIKNNGEEGSVLSLVHIKTSGASEASVASVDKPLAYCAAKAFETPVDSVVTNELKLSHSLNLQSNISINYIVSKAALEGYDSYELTAEVAGKTYILQGEEKGNYMYFTLTGLNAAMMNENVVAQLTAYVGNEVYVSPKDDYSIAVYAYTMMNREGVSEQIKSLCANLLRYGAATQIFTGYNADGLADEEMTAEQMAYLRDLDTVEFGAPYTILDDVAAPTVSWQGRTLLLDSTVAVKFLVYAPNVNAEDMELRVAYTGIDGEEKSMTVAPTVQNADAGAYVFLIDALTAAELRAELTCQVYVKGEPASKTMIYSAASYGNNKTGDLLNLCKALFAYVDEARAFFG